MIVQAQPASKADAFVFGRGAELQELRRRLQERTSFLVHGDSGAGKTFLLETVRSRQARILYCRDSGSGQFIFLALANALLAVNARRIRHACGRAGAQVLKSKSTMSLRGLVMDSLREDEYRVVLDHLRRTSAGLAADVREIIFRGDTPVTAVARSAHMEDLGFLTTFFLLQSDQMLIRPFPPDLAREFAEQTAAQMGLYAENRSQFLERMLERSGRLPGNIVALIKMALLPRYRTAGYIKFSPLYIDFRLAWHTANAW